MIYEYAIALVLNRGQLFLPWEICQCLETLLIFIPARMIQILLITLKLVDLNLDFRFKSGLLELNLDFTGDAFSVGIFSTLPSVWQIGDEQTHAWTNEWMTTEGNDKDRGYQTRC